jgi:putative membrane-bound dehydrogenase-like protein
MIRRPFHDVARAAAAMAVACAALWLCPEPLAGGEFRFGGLTLTAADGFSVTRVAGPPLVERPVTVALDEQGRLYVADSNGSNAPLAQQQANPGHRVIRLQDDDGDGTYDSRTVFADKLMMPQGTLWHRGSLYVAAPPAIWKFTDTDEDGVADERTVWFDGRTLTGCGNDLHGPYLGRDGWLYWTKGGFGEQTHDLPGRPGWKSRASHVFRARPDGTGLEPVLTGGMDNPVDVAFTAEGERILSATFLTQPAGGLRDGLIHALYGGAYGKEHGVLDGHPRTGPLLPALVHLGPAAVAGLHLHSGFSLEPNAGPSLFACSFNLRTVSRHVIIPEGGTFTAADTPFLQGDSVDFHPTDVIEDADGSLLVVDTGGWYKLCCPTSQLEKPAVLGGIYRVRRQAAKPVSDPRGLQIDWKTTGPAALAALLADPRPAVVARAVDVLAASGPAAVPAVRGLLSQATTPAAVRQAAVWTLCRIDGDAARRAVRGALADPAAAVRQVAAHAAGLHRDAAAVEALAAIVRGDDAASARAAAESLGRIESAEAMQAVLAGCRRDADRALGHSLTYALIESNRPEPLLAALDGGDARVQRIALVALDQMAPRLPAAAVPRDRVLAFCRTDDTALRDAAWWVAARHAEWSGALIAEIGPWLARAATEPAGRDAIVATLARLAGRPGAAEALAQACGDPAVRDVALAVMRTARPRTIPGPWIDALTALLQPGTSADAAAAAMHTLGTLALTAEQRKSLRPSLITMACDPAAPPQSTATALRILGDAAKPIPPAASARLVILLLDGDASPLDRADAASVIATLPGDDTLAEVAAAFDRIGPHEASLLLPALTTRGGDLLARAVEAIARSPRPAAIRRDLLAAAVAALPAEQAAAGAALLAAVDAAAGTDRQAYERLIGSLPPGDVARGHDVYASKKAACTTCHAMAYAGGQFGPDLTRIGGIRQPRDLLEAILLPSASFVRSYEPVTVVTVDGRTASGILRDQTATEIVVQTGPSTHERIPRDAVESIEPGTVSPMPRGYDTLLTPQELADLVAFLAQAR